MGAREWSTRWRGPDDKESFASFLWWCAEKATGEGTGEKRKGNRREVQREDKRRRFSVSEGFILIQGILPRGTAAGRIPRGKREKTGTWTALVMDRAEWALKCCFEK